jgi:hypothetical protein
LAVDLILVKEEISHHVFADAVLDRDAIELNFNLDGLAEAREVLDVDHGSPVSLGLPIFQVLEQVDVTLDERTINRGDLLVFVFNVRHLELQCSGRFEQVSAFGGVITVIVIVAAVACIIHSEVDREVLTAFEIL